MAGKPEYANYFSAFRRRQCITSAKITTFVIFSLACCVTRAMHSPATASNSLQMECLTLPREGGLGDSRVCLHDVQVKLVQNCSADVIERSVFPYGTGVKEHLVLPHIADQQLVTVTAVLINNEFHPQWNSTNHLNGILRDSTVISVETPRTTIPIELIVHYKLSNAVSRYSRTCTQTNQQNDANRNVFRWRAPTWKRAIERLNLRVTSMASGSRLIPVPNQHFTVQEYSPHGITLTAENLSSGVEAYVVQSGKSLCQTDLQCFDRFSWVACTKCHVAVAMLVIGAILILGSVFKPTRPYAQAFIILFCLRLVLFAFQTWVKKKV